MAAKTLKPTVRIIGVTMQRGASMHESLKVGRPVPVEELPTLADSLGGGIGLRNRHTFAMARALVGQVILVDEAEIGGANRHAYAEDRQLVEGGAAVGVPALALEGVDG